MIFYLLSSSFSFRTSPFIKRPYVSLYSYFHYVRTRKIKKHAHFKISFRDEVFTAWFPPSDTFLEILLGDFLGRYVFLLPILFPGDSDIFKAIFLYCPINFHRQLIPTNLILSPNLEEKILS